MYTIHKFPLQVQYSQVVAVPGFIGMLSVSVQRGVTVIYALVEEGGVTNKMEFRMINTGHPADGVEKGRWSFLGTANIDDGDLMRHVFWRPLKGGG